MNATLYNNASEINAVNKVITSLKSISCLTIKTETSITDPTFLVTGITDSILSQVNYMAVEQFHRYYFVRDIKSIRNGLWSLDCHVDVLMSYRAQFLPQTAVIQRQENKWNLYLDDGIFKTYQNPQIVTKVFPRGFTTQNFVLAVAGG